MRRALVAALLLAAALVLQLTSINGLRLPGGTVPDLVLLVVASLGLAGGPANGAITGFIAGLCLDLAPPATGIIGEYALVFCLVGWGCGRLRFTLARSALLPIVIAAAAAVAGEVMVAALGLALQPVQVSFASVRQVLPAAVFYDIALSPFVLYLVLLATSRLDDMFATTDADRARLRRVRAQSGSLAGQSLPGRQGLAGLPGSSATGGVVLLGLGGWLAGPPQSRKARRAAARRTPRLGSGRTGDGWVGGSLAARRAIGDSAFNHGALSHRAISSLTGGGPRTSAARLRSGVAGSAAAERGGAAARSLAARPVNLHLAASSKRDNKLGVGRRVAIGRGLSRGAMASLGRRRARRDGGFRPTRMPGGTAVSGQPRRRQPAAPTRIRFGTAGLAPASGQSGWRFLRLGRRRDGVVGGGALTRTGSNGLRSSAPRFRIRPASTGSALLAGSGPGSAAVTPFRYQGRTQPRLRMRGRRGDGTLGGRKAIGRRMSASRPASPRFKARSLTGSRPMNGKRPRFRYRRFPVLSGLVRRLRARRPGRGLGGGR